MSVSRRRFLVYLGMGTYGALLRAIPAVAGGPRPSSKAPSALGFSPLRPQRNDRLVLPPGHRYQVVCAWDDPLGTEGPFGPERFGFNADYIAYFPDPGSVDSGRMFVNHEYPNPVFVSGWDRVSRKSPEQVLQEKLCVGASILTVRREGDQWRPQLGAPGTRRFTAAYPEIPLTGAAASVVPMALGTLANCSGGVTPWGTVLTCEENYQDYNAGWRWSDSSEHRVRELQYGWVVEIDPSGELPPQKHSALGRFAHENAACTLGSSGRLVVYMGDDRERQCFYKFVSDEPFRPADGRAASRRLLEQGTLYAADFASGRWLPLDLERSPRLREFGFHHPGDLLMRAPEAAAALGATALERPEDCEVHPADGTVYLALTAADVDGRAVGRILRILETGEDPEAGSFRYEMFAAGGAESGFACPDNLLFDRQGRLWVSCDVAVADRNTGYFRRFGNNALYCVPTQGPAAGEAFRFASAPVDAEFCGPCFTPDERTLFVSVQHPGERSPDRHHLTSHWPDGGATIPRPAVVAIEGFSGS